MNFGEVKQLLYETVVRYHPGAMVVWEKVGGVTPMPPYITIGYSNLIRSQFPMSDGERVHRYYNYSFRFEINLYTVGKPIKDDSDKTIYYENTAVEDMEEFVRFLESEAITDELAEKDVTVVFDPPIRDLSELIDDTKFNYRSMEELTVTFAGLADGEYGVLGNTLVPNSSGGGLQEFTEAETGIIEEVEIGEITEGGNENHEK